jgi:hypothetical protein
MNTVWEREQEMMRFESMGIAELARDLGYLPR